MPTRPCKNKTCLLLLLLLNNSCVLLPCLMRFIDNSQNTSQAATKCPACVEGVADTTHHHICAYEQGSSAGAAVESDSIQTPNCHNLLTFPFYDEIKNIWMASSKKKHEDKAEHRATTVQHDFSFSPYDNFF